MIKFSFAAVIFLSSTMALADVTTQTCVAKAKENVEAISQIMFAPKKIDLKRTVVTSSVQKSNGVCSVEITTYDASTEPLNCTYKAEMMSNVTGECWLVNLNQTECSQ
jgi:hypothetical protein